MEAKYRIHAQDPGAKFYTVVVDVRIPPNGDPESISIGGPENIHNTVTYTVRDRVTGMFVNMVMGEMIRLGHERLSGTIMVFSLPKNDRGAEYVVYNKRFIEEVIA
ncbi:hypothetical protein LCGC14_1175650 [marine sediment metagenome]|uniref:Uncharacterized protein n=1 Tax=marine sediment metagenome TaxID=412755 RepID=A0A0F9P6P0_9ZZZZ